MTTIFDDFDEGTDVLRLLKIFPRYFVPDDDITKAAVFPFINHVDLDFVDISVLNVNEIVMTKASSLGVISTNRFFYDHEINRLYFQTAAALTSSDVVIPEVVFLFANKDVIFHLDPQDAATRTVFWDGRLSSNTKLTKSLDSSLSGFIPSFTSEVLIDNTDPEYNFLLDINNYGLSTSRLELFLASVPLDTTKTIKIFKGVIDTVSMDDRAIKLKFSDFISVFAKNIPLLPGKNVAGKDQYTGVAQSNVGFNIREVHGRKDYVRCLNVDADKVSAPKNPKWVICKNRFVTISSNLAHVELEVVASPAPTATRFYFNIIGTSPTDPQPGDVMRKFNTGTGQSDLVVTNFDRAGGFIDYVSVATVPTAGRRYLRDRIGNIYAYRNIDGVHVKQTFVSRGLESTHSLRGNVAANFTDRTAELTITHDTGNTLNSSEEDILVARVYGERVPAFMAPGNTTAPFMSPLTGDFNYWHQSILRAMERVIKNPEGVVNQQSYIDINDDLVNQELTSFFLPYDLNSQMPNVRDLISKLANSVTAQVFTDTIGEVVLRKILPPDADSAVVVGRDEIIDGSFDYNQNNADLINNVSVRWGVEDFIELGTDKLVETMEASKIYRQTFSTESFLYFSESTTEQESLCQLEADVIDNANKNKSIYAYPIGTISLALPLSFSYLKIGDTLRIERDIIQTAEPFILADIISIDITTSQVDLVLWDKKGIINNEGDFI